MKYLNSIKNKYISVNGNEVTIKFQDGVISENGENGIQVSEMIMVLYKIFIRLNQEFPCFENRLTMHYLEKAYEWQLKRTADREKRGVEGKNEL